MVKKKTKIRKEEICEGLCFVCKDGGVLRLCDFKDCLKVYHAECVKKDHSFLESEDRWTCDWHSCFQCRKRAKFCCFCCPRAVCGRCLRASEFVILREERGFCNHCLNLALLIETKNGVDCDGAKVDFNDQGTYEYLFKMYWETVKENEILTSEHVISAADSLRKGKSQCESEEYFTCSYKECQLEVSDHDDYSHRREDKLPHVRKRSKSKKNSTRKKSKTHKEFVGWASKSLVEFLTSLGRDATNYISQYEVTSIIADYCEERKLFHPEKKKKIMCDAKLQSLLRKKSINKNRLYNYLESHFAENCAQSIEEEEKEDGSGSDSIDNNEIAAGKRQKSLKSGIGSQRDELVNRRKSIFASICPDNIKLVYLKKSLVQELLKQENFEDKVVGSFVKVKTDPYDIMQKNSHQLLQVTGVRRSSVTGDSRTEILLHVSHLMYDIAICKLSDADFSEEECEDLCQRVNVGLLRRPTVVELKLKAKSLHEDITKHWIQRELLKLNGQIEQANFTGRRREFYQYWERRKLLQTPSEQSRLLNTVPEVIADNEEQQRTPSEELQRTDEEENHSLLEAIHGLTSPTPDKKLGGSKTSCGMKEKMDTADQGELTVEETSKKDKSQFGESVHREQLQPEAQKAGMSEKKLQCEVQKDEVGEKKLQPEVQKNGIGEEKVLNSVPEMKQNNEKLSQPAASMLQPPDSISGVHLHHRQEEHYSDGSICDMQNGLNSVKQVTKEGQNVLGVEICDFTDDNTTEVHSDQQSNIIIQNEPHHFDMNISGRGQNEHSDIKQRGVKCPSAIEVEVVNLISDEDDDDDDDRRKVVVERATDGNLDLSIWYLLIPSGGTVGPVSMSMLKAWRSMLKTRIDGYPYDIKYRVRKEGQSEGEAILLRDAIQQYFP